jgi:hypothetical protein
LAKVLAIILDFFEKASRKVAERLPERARKNRAKILRSKKIIVMIL